MAPQLVAYAGQYLIAVSNDGVTHSEENSASPGQDAQHAKLLADTGDLGREPVYQELRRSVQPLLVNTPT
ncbi:hypothetical protein ACIBG6_04980 [Streptomyces sp. NPDC050842]|uniref:hypothetical protein n=1 Tax=Streptomyces sp. NPDC050842 TaxID=3365636 RepID=UPI00378BDBDA